MGRRRVVPMGRRRAGPMVRRSAEMWAGPMVRRRAGMRVGGMPGLWAGISARQLSLPVRRLRTGLDAFVVKSLAKFQSLK